MRLQGFINLFSYFCTEIKVKFMNSKKPLILISNDDGYHSNGIRTLVSFLTDFADVAVCAPEAGRSGFSCAFSVVDYLLLKKRHNIPDCEVWSCTGTPVDCVTLANEIPCKALCGKSVKSGLSAASNSVIVWLKWRAIS